MAEEDKDKSERATPFKLEEAKKRGQGARSVDFVSLFIIGGLVASINAWSGDLIRTGARIGTQLLDSAPQMLKLSSVASPWLSSLLIQILILMAPFFAVAALAAMVANLVQSGPTFTAFPLKPDIQRINPVSGFKRLFSLRTLYDGAKTVFKFVVLSVVAYLAIKAFVPSLLGIQQADPRGYLPALFDHARSLLFMLLLVLAVIGLLDLAYNRWDFGKRMMMSRREIKDEVKRREGDPAVRAKLKELQRETAKRAKSLKRVSDADVLITNPEHFAIALRYEKTSMRAPCVLAKGAGELAQAMKRLARSQGTPLIESRELARKLFRSGEIDRPVGNEFFEPLARVYAEVYARREAHLAMEIRR